jgi:predicted amino acid dehydrogenase
MDTAGSTMLDMQRTKGRHTYLLLMEAGVIACDLTQIILSFDPGASVTLAQTVEAALAHAGDDVRLTTAILELGPDATRSSGLARVIEDRGGRIILIGDDAEATARTHGWPVIERPFSTEAVLSVLCTVHP